MQKRRKVSPRTGNRSAAKSQPRRVTATASGDALGILAHTHRQLALAHSPVELCQILVENAARIAAAPWTAVALYTGESTTCQVIAANRTGVAPGTGFATPEEFAAWCVNEQAHRRANRAAKNGRAYKAMPTVLQLPLTIPGYTIGTLCVVGGIATGAEMRRWLEVLCGQIANAIHNARLAEQTRQLDLVLQMLGQLGTSLSTSRSVAGQVLQGLNAVVPFDSGAVYKRDHSHQFILLSALRNGQAFAVRDGSSIDVHTLPLLHELLVIRKPIFIDDVSRALHWQPHLPEHEQGSWCGLPLIQGGTTIGLIALGGNEIGSFTREQQKILDLAARVIAPLLQNMLSTQQNRDEKARLTTLNQQLVIFQEEENRTFSRELHDEAGQSLTTLSINLGLLQQDLIGQSQTLIDRAYQSVEIARDTMEHLRGLARRMRPPTLDLLGLDGALEQLCSDIRRHTGLGIQYTGAPVAGLPDLVSLNLYRFAQEGLNNVIKHARATQAHVSLRLTEREIVVAVGDDGVGFDQAQWNGRRGEGHIGLLGMRERLANVNGSMEIISGPGKGTNVVARVPLSAPYQAPENAA